MKSKIFLIVLILIIIIQAVFNIIFVVNNNLNINDKIPNIDTTINRIIIDSIEYNIIKKDSIKWNIINKYYEDSSEIINASDSTTVAKFYEFINGE